MGKPLPSLVDRAAEEEEGAVDPPPTRPTCPACARPLPACLCAHCPPHPHPLAGRVIILQHPHEARRPKATAPLVGRCVAPVTVLVGRTFHGTAARPVPPALAAALADASAGVAPLYILWPDDPAAVAVEEAAAGGAGRPYTLLALDGTWRQAREMWGAAAGGWLGGAPGVTVVRTVGASTAALSSPPAGAGALFVEPAGGVCVSTAEAVAAGLATLEPAGSPGPPALASAVRGMAEVAAQFDPAVAARLGWVEAWGRGVEERG